MYFNAIRSAFHEDDYEVRIVDYADLYQRERGAVDICVSTCSLEEPLEAETVMIRDQTYIREIRRAIYRYKTRSLNWAEYFPPGCVAPCLKGREPARILKNLRDILVEREILPQDTPDDPGFSCLEIGNGVIFVSDPAHRCQKGFFFLGVMERPAIWDMEVAKILVMTDTVSRRDMDLQTMCYILSKWMTNCRAEDIMEKQWDDQEWMKFMSDPMED